MKKILLLGAGFVLLFAQEYRTFERQVLEKAPEIEALHLQRDVARLEGEKRLRYDNPSLEVEGSRFDADAGGDENGWRAALNQPFRVFGLGDDLKAYAQALQTIAATGYEKGVAAMKRELRTLYTGYVLAVRQKALLKERTALAERLERIAQERFREGGGTKARVMQASLQRIDAESKLLEQERRIQARYYALLKAAQTEGHPSLAAAFLYPVEKVETVKGPANPSLAQLEAESKRYEAESKVNDRSVKSWNLFTEYEEEPDQSIARIGVGVALPLFNRNAQERQIASIRAKQKRLEALKLRRQQRVQIASLKSRLENLARTYRTLEKQKKKLEALLALFTEGYKTSQISLLDLIETQKSLIETKGRLLQTQYLANLYRINIEYLEGTLQ
ncbi:TolC family protein [Hydrogenimonas sp. SS33]|uniref:TolC family protein n=1 Tax=Hydrogenimonas leucolamina TaxID=2954236 RepID=UPI00336C0756